MRKDSVRALVLTGNGTNCEVETACACRLAGAEVTICHISELFLGKISLHDFHFLNLPGGFLDGDDLGSARACAVRFKYGTVPVPAGTKRFVDDLLRFIEDGKLILGVCNGFQLMVKLGLLPGDGGMELKQTASLMHNDSGRFEDRWVHLNVERESPCIFTRGLTQLYLPVRHGEGKFITADDSVSAAMARNKSTVIRYANPGGEITADYPWNPNGSQGSVAGVCSLDGRLFGMMPHPEAYLHRTNHPAWTREELPEEGQGLAIFRNGVDYVRRELL